MLPRVLQLQTLPIRREQDNGQLLSLSDVERGGNLMIGHVMYRVGGRYGLPQCMSMARTMGMTEEAVFRGVTSAPADSLGRPWGRLKVGCPADIALLNWEKEPFCLKDRAGNRLESELGYRCKLTVSDGNIVYKD